MICPHLQIPTKNTPRNLSQALKHACMLQSSERANKKHQEKEWEGTRKAGK